MVHTGDCAWFPRGPWRFPSGSLAVPWRFPAVPWRFLAVPWRYPGGSLAVPCGNGVPGCHAQFECFLAWFLGHLVEKNASEKVHFGHGVLDKRSHLGLFRAWF